jgi:hypothetical protein
LRRSSTLTRATKLRLFRRSNAFAPNPQGRQSARWAFDPRPLSSPVRNGRLHLTVKTSGAAPKRITPAPSHDSVFPLPRSPDQ